jgi:hypothetical protein
MSLQRRERRRQVRRDRRFPRGSIQNSRITPLCTEGYTSVEDLQKMSSPLDEQMKGIQVQESIRLDNPSVRKFWEERHIGKDGVFDENNSDGLNCFGNPFVDLGDVDYRVSDSVENHTPRFMSFDQMVEMNSSKMVTPNGSLLTWGQGITDEYIQKVLKEDPSVREEKIKIEYRLITNSTVFKLTEELGFTDDVLNDSELMKRYMCWCVRLIFHFKEHSFLMDTPVETYKNILLTKGTK